MKGNVKPLGLVWVDCPDSVMTDGLVHALKKQARVHIGGDPPLEDPSSIIFYASDREELAEGVERHRELSADAPPILVFSPHLDLVLAMEALRTGASGFIHASMESDQLVRAVAVAATKGELVAPRELISFLIT
ncbi:MAG TPA: hypothetical protein VK869_15160, partial [Rubrobacteraceae bacterium]|nr:hypothetical protein [Rubrobacteraceae bacterium]